MQRLERPFAVRIARILDKTANQASAAVASRGKSAGLKSIVKQQEAALLKIFKPHYTQTIKIFGKRILDAFKSFDGYQTKAEDVFAVEVEEWIRTTSAEQVQHITQTTADKLRNIIELGFEDGLTGAQVASNIVDRTGGAIAKNRALTISRTETHMAASFGSQTAAESTGVPLKRVWISAADERTRENHTDADSASHSKPVKMDAEFPVVHLQYPGDPSGDPAETINCRCVVGYVSAKK